MRDGNRTPVETVVGISTDKAVAPVNVMGMTKAIQERVFIRANLDCPDTRFCVVRYGNVLASRGSVIPLFHDQIKAGGPVTITSLDMTRFLLSLDEAVNTVFAALREARRGETYVPRVPSAKIVDLAAELIGDRPVETRIVGVRPGEKIHESLVSGEEAFRTFERGSHYVIQPILPEIRDGEPDGSRREGEYTSDEEVASREAVAELLIRRRLRVEDGLELEGEFLR
jgi:FlaA1/EpsC-like NDP-sugar epimerase